MKLIMRWCNKIKLLFQVSPKLLIIYQKTVKLNRIDLTDGPTATEYVNILQNIIDLTDVLTLTLENDDERESKRAREQERERENIFPCTSIYISNKIKQKMSSLC